MSNKKNIFFHSLTLPITLISMFSIFDKNIHVKNSKSLQSSVYVWNAEKLAEISKKRHKNASVVLNEETGYWENEKIYSITIIHDLTIGDEGDNEQYLFYGLGDVIADNEKNIYVALREEGLIRKYNPEGKYLQTIGQNGKGPGELLQPTRLLIDNKNVLHIIEYGNSRISRFNLAGLFLGSTPIQCYRTPRQFGFDGNENYYISYLNHTNENVIHKFDKKGKLIKSFGESLYLTREIHFAEKGAIISESNQGHLFVDKDILYFSRRNPYDIRKYTLDGELISLIFRKNEFMPPNLMRITGKQRYRFSPPVQSSFIAIRENMLINLIFTPEKIYDKTGFSWLLDIFDLNGNLLINYKNHLPCIPTFFDNNRNIYGFSFDHTKIYRFSFEFKSLKEN